MRPLVLVILLCTLAAADDAAAVLAPSKASQLVTLAAGGGCPIVGHPTDTGFTQRATSDGALVPFSIPAKQALLLTNIDVSITNQVVNDNVGILIVAGSNTPGTIVAGRVVAVPAGGVASVTFTPPNGIAVKSGTSLCMSVVNFTRGGLVPVFGIAHGFLAPDK
jgi:hypothetical protein